MRVCDVHGIEPPLVKHGKLKDVCAYCVIEDAASGERQYKKELIAERAKVADIQERYIIARDKLKAAEAKVARLREAIEAAKSHLDWPGARNNASANCALRALHEALKEVQRDA